MKRLKQEIERLGPVNLSAIEQFEQVDERHQFLVSQRDDLLNAKEQLFETMDEMDQEVKNGLKKSLKQFVASSKWYFLICLVADGQSWC